MTTDPRRLLADPPDRERVSDLLRQAKSHAVRLHDVLVELRPGMSEWSRFAIAQLAVDAEVISRRLGNVERILGDGPDRPAA